MRLLSRRAAAVLAAAACSVVALAGCDSLPSRGKIGAVAAGPGVVTVLWGTCPGEQVRRVELRLTDKKHAKTVRVVWAIEADTADTANTANTADTAETSFTAGRTPPGYREVVPFAGPLPGASPVSAVVTSTTVNKEFLDFTVGELRTDDVLVNRSPRHVTRAAFAQRVDKLCAR